MPKLSAGLIMYRRQGADLQVFLIHPGGPFWANRDTGVWSIPKGEHNGSEAPLDAARREFHEETGFSAHGPFVELGSIRQASGKVVTAWGFEGDCNPADLSSNLCTVEWPPRSGRMLEIPEVDRGGWFSIAQAEERIMPAQKPFLARLLASIGEAEGAAGA
jgi:predicted NUDIX family NTP pyrophosphohydrolase